MDLFGIIIEKFSTEFVMELFSININQEPIMVDMLIDLTQAGVLTVLLVVMILKSNDTILIYEHGILHLSKSVGQLTCSSLLIGFKLCSEVNTL